MKYLLSEYIEKKYIDIKVSTNPLDDALGVPYQNKYITHDRDEVLLELAERPVLDADGKDTSHPMYGRTNSHYQPPASKETKRKMRGPRKGGWSWSEETKQKASEDRKGKSTGEDNPNWKGGVTSNLKAYNAMKAREYRRRKNQDDHL